MTELVGQVVGERYKVEAFLGRGGMAAVYKVFDLQRAVYLAMKILNSEVTGDPAFMGRFESEARILAMLQHPNIVRFYGLEKAGKLSFILMDFIDGMTLRREIGLHKNGLLPERILEVMQPVCAALYYAHQMGLVHCDIKSSNMMVHRNGSVYLTDFGIARASRSSSRGQVSMGTRAYMAPEHMQGEPPTPAMDVYSLGVVLYEMLTGGQYPFTGASPQAEGDSITQKMLWEKRNLPAPAPSKLNPSISAALDMVVLRCMEREPQRRFVSSLDLLHALTAAIHGEDNPEESQTRADLVTAPPTGQSAQPGWPRLPFVWRMRWAGWLAGAAILLAGAFLMLRAAPVLAPSAQVTPTGMAGASVEQPTRAPTRTLTSTARITPSPLPTATPTAQPTPLGGGRLLAFASDRGDSVQIWTVDTGRPDDRPAQRTNVSGGACQPDWSPDGARLAFTTPCRGPSVYYPGSTIKVVDLATGAVTDLLPRSAGAFDPAWSPDGKTIVYTAIVGEETEIRAIDLESGQATVLANRGDKNNQPAWSPDGRYIAFLSSDITDRDALWLMRPDGSSQELLDRKRAYSEPAWSPDGRYILVSMLQGSFPRLMRFDRTRPTEGMSEVLPYDYRMSHSDFSPDGHWLAFWTEDSRNVPKIMLANLASKQASQFFQSTSREFQPDWQPYYSPE